MRGMVSLATVLALMAALAVPVLAQAPKAFPIGATYKVISISGFDVQKTNMTVTKSSDTARLLTASPKK